MGLVFVGLTGKIRVVTFRQKQGIDDQRPARAHYSEPEAADVFPSSRKAREEE
jgi:hypothetical protein